MNAAHRWGTQGGPRKLATSCASPARTAALLLASLVALVTAPGINAASVPTFQITSLFSNLDGSVQLIVLREAAGANGQHRFAGLKLTVEREGVIRELVFDRDLPFENTAFVTIVVGTHDFPLQSAGNAWMCCGAPDYPMPARFLPADGGSVDFAGVDRVTYGPLPTDGVQSWQRDGSIGRVALPTSVCAIHGAQGCRQGVFVGESTVRIVEYYNPALDRYFMTASAVELDTLDSGRIRGWERTGVSIAVGATSLVMVSWNVWDLPFPPPFPMHPVCRYYLPPGSGDSHFLSISQAECAEVRARYPHFVLETEAAFYAALPDPVTGACAQGSTFLLEPMYRLWNARQDTEHRYTLDPSVREELVARGYTPEGYGPLGVAFCVPRGI